MKRRSFLRRLAATGVVLPMAMGFPRVRAFAASPDGSPFGRITAANKDRIFVMIRLAGGNDGLNTVVPYTNSQYYTARTEGNLAIAADQVVKLSDSSTLGLHPSLAPLSALYQEKKMTIIQNVGYPNQNLSHFRSTDIWLSGSDADVYDNAGWYAKYLEGIYPDYPATLPKDPFAIELGTYLSTTLVGEKNNMGMALANLDYIPGAPDSDPVTTNHQGDEEQYVREIIRQSNTFFNSILAAGQKQTANKVQYPNNALAQGLAGIARVIAGGLATQMYIINVGGYDTHSNQLTAHANLHDTFANAVLAFQRDLEAFGLDKNVCFMTISEFGRRPKSNGTGTDHGSAAPMFVFGSGVRAGIIGADPNLSSLDKNGNLQMQYDFRQLYASILGQWFGASESEITPKALPRHFEQLPIFQTNTTTSVYSKQTIDATLSLGQNYPNPASTVTYIPIAGILSGSVARLEIMTMDGRPISSYEIMPGQNSVAVQTSTLENGTYLYVLNVDGVTRMNKMLVSR